MSSAQKRILAIDDQPGFLEALARMINHLGFEPVLAPTARLGLQRMREGSCVAVLLDMRLPDLSGHAVLRELKRAGCPVPIIAMSGDGTMDDAIQAFRDSAVDYLKKPFTVDELRVSLERVLAARPTPGPRPQRDTPVANPWAVQPTSKSGSDQHAIVLSGMLESFPATKIKVPVLDPRITDLHRLLDRDDLDMSQLGALIARDPALAAAVMRRVCSPAFGAANPKSVHEACTRLGTRELIRVALHTLYESQFTASAEPYRSFMAASWRSALATSHAAAEIARMMGRDDVDQFRTLGLLHNIGELACLSVLSHCASDGGQPIPTEQIGAEVARSHERVGEALAKAWDLPLPILRVIANHHRAERDLAAVVVLAGWSIATAAGFEALPGQTVPDPTRLLPRLGLSRHAIEPIVTSLEPLRDAGGAPQAHAGAYSITTPRAAAS